jgi:hypothetical protein
MHDLELNPNYKSLAFSEKRIIMKNNHVSLPLLAGSFYSEGWSICRSGALKGGTMLIYWKGGCHYGKRNRKVVQ